jgi:hypothetical protein
VGLKQAVAGFGLSQALGPVVNYFSGCKMNKIGQNACKFSSNIPDILLKFACILAQFLHFSLSEK